MTVHLLRISSKKGTGLHHQSSKKGKSQKSYKRHLISPPLVDIKKRLTKPFPEEGKKNPRKAERIPLAREGWKRRGDKRKRRKPSPPAHAMVETRRSSAAAAAGKRSSPSPSSSSVPAPKRPKVRAPRPPRIEESRVAASRFDPLANRSEPWP